MQVVGFSPAFAVVAEIASRATRPQVREWADRVLRRHVRRTPALMRELTSPAALRSAAAADGLEDEVCQKLLAMMKAGEKIYTPSKDGLATLRERGFDTMDFIESLPVDDRRIRHMERLSWSDAEVLSERWHASLSRLREKASGLLEGTRKIFEFEDGMFMVALETAGALAAEGSNMGHCVGGYWSRVKGGACSIVSLRDADGEPHVTVELARPVVTNIDGIGAVSVMGDLRAGVNDVMVLDTPWYAAQIRGKQNRMPVERYASLVRRWLQVAGVPSREQGFINVVGGVKRVYCIDDPTSRKRFVTSEPDRAFEAAAQSVLSGIRSDRQRAVPKSLVRGSGLFEIANDITDVSVIDVFARQISEEFALSLKEKHGDATVRVLKSGIKEILDRCAELTGSASGAMDEIVRAVVAVDQEYGYRQDVLEAVKVGKESLGVVCHSVPTGGLVLMSKGMAAVYGDKIIEDFSSDIRKMLAAMRAAPEKCHVVAMVPGCLLIPDFQRAIHAFGLSADLEAAVAISDAAIRSKVKTLRLEMKRLRANGMNVNFAANVLADGFEHRIFETSQVSNLSGGLVLSPKPVSASPSVRLTADPVVKTYAAPRR